MAAVADIPTATAAPPTDPVRAALEDADNRAKWIAHARATLGFHRGEAEDAVQEASRRVWLRRETFDPTAGSVYGWVFGYVKKVCLEVSRAAGKPPPPPSAPPTPAASRMALEEVRAAVDQFLARLPADQRTAVELRRLHELDYPEIAARMSTSVVNARQLVSRGLLRLQALAKQEDRS